MHVAVSAPSALQHDLPAVLPGHVRYDFSAFSQSHYGACRDFQDDVRAVLPVAALFAAFLSVRRGIFSVIAVVGQSVHPGIHLEDNISAPAPVSAVRAAVRDKFLTAETDMSVTALSGPDQDLRSVCKHNIPFKRKGIAQSATPLFFPQSDSDYSAAASTSTGMIETCFLNLPSLENLTTPSAFAYSVSSLPRPTF